MRQIVTSYTSRSREVEAGLFRRGNAEALVDWLRRRVGVVDGVLVHSYRRYTFGEFITDVIFIPGPENERIEIVEGYWILLDSDDRIEVLRPAEFERLYQHNEDAKFSELVRWDPGNGDDAWSVEWPSSEFLLAACVGESIQVWIPGDEPHQQGESMWLEIKDVAHVAYANQDEYWVSSDGHDFETMRRIFDALKAGARP